MTKKSNILKVVKEDILRILSERKGKVSLDIIKEEIKVSYSFVSEAIEELEREELIQSRQVFFTLTEGGEEKARDILKKHLVFEDYFKKTRTEREAHKIANILEHYVSNEVLNNIKKLSTLKEEGISLTKFKLYERGLITNIRISSDELFERMVSMGIFPGGKIMITNELSNVIIVKIRYKKLALDKDIAKEIKVV